MKLLVLRYIELEKARRQGMKNLHCRTELTWQS